MTQDTTQRGHLPALIAGVLILVTAALTARMLLGARREVLLATVATARGDPPATDLHLRHAIAYYLPGNPWVDAAVHRLRARARDAEDHGDPIAATRRWRALRSAILALRGATTPYSNILQEAGQHIAQLSVALPPGIPPPTTAVERTHRASRLAARLTAPETPRAPFVALGLAGFVTWILGAFLFIARGLTPDLSWVPRHAGMAAIVTLLGLTAFLSGMALA